MNSNTIKQLLTAAETGNLNLVKSLINKGVDPTAKDYSGYSAIHYAAKRGHLEVIKYLLNKTKVDVNERGEYGNTPLMWAADQGHLEVIQFLVEKKHADLNIVSEYGNIALHDAVGGGHVDVVQYLIEKGSNYKIANKRGDTPLGLAKRLKNEDIIDLITTFMNQLPEKENSNIKEWFVKEYGGDINARDVNGRTPLHNAAANGNLEFVEYLVEEEMAELNSVDNGKDTPLHLAAWQGRLEIVKYLVGEKTADVHIKNSSGRTPIHLAALGGQLPVIKYFLEDEYVIENSPIDVLSTDTIGDTCLHMASWQGHLQVVKYLIEKQNADVTIKNTSGRTPLHLAVINGHLNVVKYLVESSTSDLTAKDGSGDTPLLLAANYGHLAVVKYFVEEKKVSLNVRNNSGLTALQLARLDSDDKANKLAVVAYLEKREKRRNSRSINNKKPTVNKVEGVASNIRISSSVERLTGDKMGASSSLLAIDEKIGSQTNQSTSSHLSGFISETWLCNNVTLALLLLEWCGLRCPETASTTQSEHVHAAALYIIDKFSQILEIEDLSYLDHSLDDFSLYTELVRLLRSNNHSGIKKALLSHIISQYPSLDKALFEKIHNNISKIFCNVPDT